VKINLKDFTAVSFLLIILILVESTRIVQAWRIEDTKIVFQFLTPILGYLYHQSRMKKKKEKEITPPALPE
jgi:hypothetical protein